MDLAGHVKLPALSSSDTDRARIVLIVISTLCVIAVILVLAVIVLTSIHQEVPTELWTLTTSIVTAMVALLVKVSSTEGGTPADPMPVTVADEPVQVQEVSASSAPTGFGEPTWNSSVSYPVPAKQGAQPSPFPQS